MVTGVMNLGFNILAARLFGPVAYGIISSLMALVTLVSTPTAAIGLATAGWMADEESHFGLRYSLGQIRLAMLCIGSLIALGVCLFSMDISRTLRVNNIFFVVVAIMTVIPGYTGSAIMGALQGLKNFFAAGASAALGSLAKLIALVMGMVLGGTVMAGSVALVAGSFASWLMSEFSIRSEYKSRSVETGERPRIFAWSQFKGLLHKVVGTSALTAGGTVFLNVDILLAKHFLAPNSAGLFAALGSSGRMILFATGAIPSVLYPSLISGKSSLASFRLLLLAQGITALICLAGCAIYILDPRLVVMLLFGREFVGITPYLFEYGLAFSFYALASVFLVYLLYQETRWIWAYAILGGMAEIVILSIWHHSILEFTWGVLLFFTLLFVVSGLHVGRFGLTLVKVEHDRRKESIRA